MKYKALKRIELGFMPPFYIMRLGDYINLWNEHGHPLKPVFAPTKKKDVDHGQTNHPTGTCNPTT